jgi:flavin-binding protein dodecin
MSDPTYKKIEIVGTSTKSFSDAVSNGIAKAAETIHGISWFEVTEQRGSVAEGQIRQFQVTVSVGFKVD